MRARGASDEQRGRIAKLEQEMDKYSREMSQKLNLLSEAKKALA